MTRDLIAEVAESCAGAWYPPGPDCNLLRDSIDAVLRERFEVVETNFHTGKDDGRVCTRDGWYRRYKGEDHNVQIILVPRPLVPVPTVAEAARAAESLLSAMIDSTPQCGEVREVRDGLRAALKAEGRK